MPLWIPHRAALAASLISLATLALDAAAGIKVLVAGAPSTAAWNNDVVAKIKAAGVLDTSATIDVFNAKAGTPTLASLKGYDAVLVYADGGTFDPNTLGNNLADYVDAGGNVVEMVFGNYSGEIAGRWESASYSPMNHNNVQINSNSSLGTLAIKSHPILSGVTTFTGGSSSYRVSSSLNTNAFLIASWADGIPFAATRHDKAGHIATLNFFPPSSDALSAGWPAAGNVGGKLMANALAFVADHHTDVLILGAPATASWLDDVKNTVRAFGRVGGAVDTFSIASGTPTLAQLKKYDAVLVFTDAAVADPVTLGNNLADYIDAGGGVVQAEFSFKAAAIGGRYASGNYSPMGAGTFSGAASLTLGTVAMPAHPIMAGVTALRGGTSSFFFNGTAASGANLVASWSNGVPLVLTRDTFAGRVAVLNFYPPSSASRSDFWDKTSDGGALLGNALKYAARRDNDVLILGDSQTFAAFADITAKLAATGQIKGKIDTFDWSLGTPSLALLHRYDSVLLYSFLINLVDRDTCGNILADYVDSGGGVLMMYAANYTGWGPAGRWLSAGYSPLQTTSFPGAAEHTLGTRYLPKHPVLYRVATFDAGAYSYRSTGLLRAGSVRIADYDDGVILAAERSTKSGRVVELNFMPGSNSISGWTGRLWLASTDGARLMANSLNYVARSDLSTLILATTATRPEAPADILAKLRSVGRIRGRLDTFNMNAAVPPPGLLSAYDVALCYTDSAPASPATIGDNLAAFNDLGFGVVVASFANSTSTGILGRWSTQGYSPLSSLTSAATPHLTLGYVYNPASPLLAGVKSFDTGTNTFLCSQALATGATGVADFSNGFPLVAEKKQSTRQVVGLNFLPDSSDALASGWLASTDGALLLSNAITYAASNRPCPGDFNNDGFLDIFDFNDFIDAFDAGTPTADFNGDGFNDIFDFNDFVDAFTAGC